MEFSQLEIALKKLRERYGEPHRSTPAAPLESLLSALLEDGAARGDRRQATANLREAGLLDAQRLAATTLDELAEMIRPAGNAEKRANRLRRVMQFAVERYAGDIAAMFETDAESLRSELLSLRGVGPETADAILLLAARKPGFVAGLAAHRVLKRHGWIEFEADRQSVKEYVELALDRDPEALSALHLLLERVGRDHCRKRPLCDGCPLAELLPAGGPRKEEGWE